jgi:hypothetical protein
MTHRPRPLVVSLALIGLLAGSFSLAQWHARGGASASHGAMQPDMMQREMTHRGAMQRGWMQRGWMQRGWMQRAMPYRGAMQPGAMQRGATEPGATEPGAMMRFARGAMAAGYGSGSVSVALYDGDPAAGGALLDTLTFERQADDADGRTALHEALVEAAASARFAVVTPAPAPMTIDLADMAAQAASRAEAMAANQARYEERQARMAEMRESAPAPRTMPHRMPHRTPRY